MKMDPTAFRAQMLMNFRVHLGPGELGAVFDEFDKDNSKLIDGAEARPPDCLCLYTSKYAHCMRATQDNELILRPLSSWQCT